MNTINISTSAALLAASCGCKIVKHGNRKVSSHSGSSDLISSFGIELDMPAEKARQSLDQFGICFLFAPSYHQGISQIMPVRKKLKTRTIFNLVGPLVNPALPPLTLVGVYQKELLLPVAKALNNLGVKRAFIVYGSGIDEVALHGPTHMIELDHSHFKPARLMPEDFGLGAYPLEAIKGGGPEKNKTLITAVLKGKGAPAHQAIIAANTALLLRLFGHENIKENTERVRDIMAEGRALTLIHNLIKQDTI